MVVAKVKSKSLYKSIQILECFSTKQFELGITEISKKLKLNKSNVHNLVSTLVEAGYLEKNPTSDKYHLSKKLLQFSFVITSNFKLQNEVHQMMQILADEFGAYVYFGTIQGYNVLYLQSVFPKTSNESQIYRSITGEIAPLYATSIGKALLMTMSDKDIKDHIDPVKQKFTDNTLLDDKEIFKEVKLSQKRGYSIDNIEHENNVRCVGIPIFKGDNELVGAISVSGSVNIVTPQKVEKIAKRMADIALDFKRRY
jgi:IclR family KDG regulon transcriptional repressor